MPSAWRLAFPSRLLPSFSMVVWVMEKTPLFCEGVFSNQRKIPYHPATAAALMLPPHLPIFLALAPPTPPPPPPTYTIVIDKFDDEAGDDVTFSPNKGVAGTNVTLSYAVANTKPVNQLELGGVNAAIALVESYGAGTRTYTIRAADAANSVITITAVFTHTDHVIDHIAFSEHNDGHITATYGDQPFTNAITTTHEGSGGREIRSRANNLHAYG